MSEAKEVGCVCGHPKDAHIDLMGDRCTQDCQCRLLRLVLDWPDEAGWWWMQGSGLTHVPIASGLCFFYNGAWRSREEYREIFGPACFVKLLEANPFEAE